MSIISEVFQNLRKSGNFTFLQYLLKEKVKNSFSYGRQSQNFDFFGEQVLIYESSKSDDFTQLTKKQAISNLLPAVQN